MSVHLNTTAGNILIEQRQESGRCVACGLRGGGLADFTVTTREHPHGFGGTFCGSCLAHAIGVYDREQRQARGLPARNPVGRVSGPST